MSSKSRLAHPSRPAHPARPARPAHPKLYSHITAIVKGHVNRWPSAYASGRVVREYKAAVKALYGPRAKPYLGSAKSKAPLTTWFQEQWIDILTGRPCGSVKSHLYYPVCRPKSVALRLTALQIANAVKRKQRMKEKTTTYRW